MKSKYTSVTIGTFDGVHKGHAALIKRLKALNLKTVAVVLEKPLKNVSGLITTHGEKIGILSLTGIDEIFVIPPGSEIFNMTAENFLKDFLINRLKAKHIVVGHDFVFGKNKTGTYGWLRRLAPKLNLRVDLVRAVKCGKTTISSSNIRHALKSADIESAAKMLGRNYSFSGVSVKGRGAGREIGFPTINIKTDESKILPQGVFVAAVKINNVLYPAVLNIGRRPTFNAGSEIVPEAHILGAFRKLKRPVKAEVTLLKKIRAEKKFSSVSFLVKAIKKDISKANRHFGIKNEA